MNGRALIIHALFDVLGGGELFALKLAQALVEGGFNVEILTSTPLDHDKIRAIYGNVKLPRVLVKRVEEAELLSKLMPGRLVRLRRLLVYRAYESMMKRARSEYDLVFDTQSNLPTPVDISYIHYPTLLSTKGDRVAWAIYNQLVRLMARGYKTPRSGRILVNSSWTAHAVYKVHGVIPDVLYPPVDVEYFNTLASNPNREKAIVTISRFTPEKRLDVILDVARELPDYRFILVGSTGPGSERVIGELKVRIDELRLENVELKPNLPRDKLRELLGEAMFYLHPEFAEHFGIAVIEAMSAGVVPIVYRDGGVWHDIVSRVSDTLGYTSISEVPRIVKILEGDRDAYVKLREKAISISKLFNYENFKKNLLEKVDYALKIKRLGD
ncbi:MAG: glycosyltransferase [Desulfurococcaceae archaeon]|nr:glycosyltransferase [Desulfurococcaceae archaeon]